MAVQDQITRIKTNISNAYKEIENKGGTIPAKANSENLASAISTIKISANKLNVVLKKNYSDSSITLTGAGEYDVGDTVVITATSSDIHYAFIRWEEDGKTISNSYKYTFVA